MAGLSVGVLLLAAALRAALFLAYAMLEIPSSDQPFHLEGNNVHFAWCVQHGLPLYPSGQGLPYTVNYMGPCYYWIVGGIGRMLGADIPDLYVMGQITSFLCALAPAVIAGWYLYRRYGGWPCLAGVLFGLGSVVKTPWGVMARPDTMANLLGAAGFFIACRRSWRWMPVAAAALAFGCLTKQTAVVWLVAAVVALLASPGARIYALALLGAAAGIAIGTIAVLAATGEPFIVQSLLSQGALPFDVWQLLGNLWSLLLTSPQVLVFVLIGGCLWMTRKHHDRDLSVLVAMLLCTTPVFCMKQGANLNYFIPFQVVEAIAAGTLCAAALRAKERTLRWMLACWIGTLALQPNIIVSAQQVAQTVRRRAVLASETGGADQQAFEQYLRLARDPNVRLLTDNDRLAVYQGSQAAFYDAYLFRLQVESHRLDPQELVDRLRMRWYRYIILTVPVDFVGHAYSFYRLPPQVAAAIRLNYRLQSKAAHMYLYVPLTPQALSRHSSEPLP
jgi:hypothetical protein